MREIKLHDLKAKSPTELLAFAEEHEVENASTLRKQELMFAILKQLASVDIDIIGEGVVEVLQDGFGFLRSPDANYLAGPDDIYISPSQIRRFALRTGDTVEGEIRSPKEGERYFALLKVNKINFEDPEKARHKVHFDNLTPLYPNQRLKLEHEDPTRKDFSARVHANDALGMIAQNVVFHLSIAAAGRNRHLTEAYQRILVEGRRNLRLYFRSYGDTLPGELATAHDAQVDAIAAQDEDLAERLAHEHAEEVHQRFLHFLSSRNTRDFSIDYV